MPDMLDTAAAWLDAQLADNAAIEVTYTQGATAVDLAATIGKTVFEVADAYGGLVRVESRDYLVAAAALGLEPRRGDLITEGDRTYEVTAPGKEPCFREADPSGRTYRIHTARAKANP